MTSQIAELNALDPKYLSMGQRLNDQFVAGQTQLDGVPVPFPNFATTMKGCAPSVAQALLPYPQFCDGIFGLNENKGSATYNSLQLKGEHRFSDGLWFLASYTKSKQLTNADSDGGGTFSPYQAHRYKGLAVEDIPQVFTGALRYDLPFGRDKRWLRGSRVVNSIAGGWGISTTFRVQSGIPFSIISSSCNVPSQLRVKCKPALLSGANPYAQPNDGSFNPAQPLLNATSFEPVSSFQFYAGNGPRVQN